VPERKLDIASKQFLKFFQNAFNKETPYSIPIIQASTTSIMLPYLTHFQHDGKLIEYKGIQKDLALIKYCSSGFIDQNNMYHHVISDVYNKIRLTERKIPNIPFKYWAVVFVTNDKALGMKQATSWLEKLKGNKCTSSIFLLPDEYSTVHNKHKSAGELLAVDLKKRFVKATKKGWFFDFTNQT
jgi:roadblock/LC7 domain-containing protein